MSAVSADMKSKSFTQDMMLNLIIGSLKRVNPGSARHFGILRSHNLKRSASGTISNNPTNTRQHPTDAPFLWACFFLAVVDYNLPLSRLRILDESALLLMKLTQHT